MRGWKRLARGALASQLVRPTIQTGASVDHRSEVEGATLLLPEQKDFVESKTKDPILTPKVSSNTTEHYQEHQNVALPQRYESVLAGSDVGLTVATKQPRRSL